MTTFNFKNQVVVVTGGSSGIGNTTVRSFREAGARVVCVDLHRPQKPVQDVRYLEADVANFQAVGTCVKTILKEEKAIDCLINNAGISRDAPVWRMSEKDWDAVLKVNLKGAFNFIHHAAPHFRQANHGKIVNISSINGMRGKFGLVNYSAAKAGLIGLTKTIAKELGRHSVNVNAVAPGYVLTPLMANLPEKIIEGAKTETVFGRLAQPEDVANVILFLCSDEAKHITGEVIKVDGGQYI